MISPRSIAVSRTSPEDELVDDEAELLELAALLDELALDELEVELAELLDVLLLLDELVLELDDELLLELLELDEELLVLEELPPVGTSSRKVQR